MKKLIIATVALLALSGCAVDHYHHHKHVHSVDVTADGFVTYDNWRNHHGPKPSRKPVYQYKNYDLNKVYRNGYHSQPKFGTGNNIGNTCHTRGTC